jgi:beta-galactosidase
MPEETRHLRTEDRKIISRMKKDNKSQAEIARTIGFSQPSLGTFPVGGDLQEIKFPKPVTGSQFCIETLNAHDDKPFAAIAELDVLDPEGNSISHQKWTIAYVDSEELTGEDGSASNAIDGQSSNFWHSAWKDSQPNHPHRLIIDFGAETRVGGFTYTPRAGNKKVTGRIKDYRIFVGNALAIPSKP